MTSGPAPTRPEACVGCGAPLHSKVSKPEDRRPGSKRYACHGLCHTCHKRVLRTGTAVAPVTQTPRERPCARCGTRQRSRLDTFELCGDCVDVTLDLDEHAAWTAEPVPA